MSSYGCSYIQSIYQLRLHANIQISIRNLLSTTDKRHLWEKKKNKSQQEEISDQKIIWKGKCCKSIFSTHNCMIEVTWAGSSSTEKLNSSPHMGFLEPGIIELQYKQKKDWIHRQKSIVNQGPSLFLDREEWSLTHR